MPRVGLVAVGVVQIREVYPGVQGVYHGLWMGIGGLGLGPSRQVAGRYASVVMAEKKRPKMLSSKRVMRAEKVGQASGRVLNEANGSVASRRTKYCEIERASEP